MYQISPSCNVQLDIRPMITYFDNTSWEIPDRVALYDTEGRYLSVVSKKSADNMRTYEEFANMIGEGVSQYGKQIIVEDKLHLQGKRFSRIMRFPEETYDFKINNRNEKYQLTMWSWSSYDLGWAEQWIFGPLCIICMNGQFTSAWKIQALSKKNWFRKSNMTGTDITTAIQNFQEYPEFLEQVAGVNVKDDEVQTLFRRTIAAKPKKLYTNGYSDLYMKQLGELWNKYQSRLGSNLYSVYQTATDWASHPQGRGYKMNKVRDRSTKVSKMVESEYWLNLINKPKTNLRGFAPAAIASNF